MPSRRHAVALTRLRSTSATRKTESVARSMAMADSDSFVAGATDVISFGDGIGTEGGYHIVVGTVTMVVDVVLLTAAVTWS